MPMSFGSDRMVPRKLERPLSSAATLRLRILPTASSLRLTGVTSSVAMVPRSFSPAMDSGATAIQPLNTNMSMSIGTSMAKTMPAMSSSLARSYVPPPAFTSKRLARLCS